MVAAVLIGTWVAHGLEYVRIWGLGQYRGAVSGSTHAYLGPVGVALVVTGALATYWTRVLAEHLDGHLADLRRRLLTRDGPSAGTTVSTPPLLSFPALIGALWLSQVSLYVFQENLEASVARFPIPGLGVVSGPHAPALLVHLAVALVTGTILYLASRRVTSLVREVRQTAALLARRRRREPHTAPLWPGTPLSWTPAERWGRQSWSRPPPGLEAF